jgi:pyruvate-formate lyase
MMTAATMPRDLAAGYADLCRHLADGQTDIERREEFYKWPGTCPGFPGNRPTFWEALQALWINHMLIMSDENYPGPGVSFGRWTNTCCPTGNILCPGNGPRIRQGTSEMLLDALQYRL